MIIRRKFKSIYTCVNEKDTCPDERTDCKSGIDEKFVTRGEKPVEFIETMLESAASLSSNGYFKLEAAPLPRDGVVAAASSVSNNLICALAAKETLG